MKSFFIRNKHKLVLVAVCLILLITLSGCRTSASTWYAKPYTTYGQDWVDMWDGGSGFWQSLWGWPINILSYPIALMCSAIGKGLGNSYLWGIFFTTLIVRTVAWPIYARTNSMSLKMQQMQPEMNRIQKKYAGRQDPRSQQQMQQEMSKLYKKYKINPLGCIGPMLLQFPIFMAMYEVVQRINATSTTVVNGAISMVSTGEFALSNTKVFGFFEMNTSFFSASSAWDKVFAAFIAVAFVGLQILQQKLSSRPTKYQRIHPNDKKNQKNQMKWVMIIMNVMFGFMALSNTTLGIYWLIGALYQIFQSEVGRFINNKKYEKMQARPDVF